MYIHQKALSQLSQLTGEKIIHLRVPVEKNDKQMK